MRKTIIGLLIAVTSLSVVNTAKAGVYISGGYGCSGGSFYYGPSYPVYTGPVYVPAPVYAYVTPAPVVVPAPVYVPRYYVHPSPRFYYGPRGYIYRGYHHR